MMRLSASFATLCLLVAAPAYADDCTPEFVDSTATANISDLNIGLGEFSRENFNIHVRNTGTGDCSAELRISRSPGSIASNIPPYILRSGPVTFNIQSQDASELGGEGVNVTHIPNDPQDRAVPFEITVPSEWGLKAGDFGDQLELALFDQSGGKLDTMLLNVNISIPQAVAVRFVGSTGTDDIARIDLGTMSATTGGRSDPFGVRVWSTSGYRVDFSSDNHGDLVHEGNLDRFPYQLFMGNEQVDLVSGADFVFPNFTTSAGTVHILRAQAKPATVRAGEYSDRITVSVTAV